MYRPYYRWLPALREDGIPPSIRTPLRASADRAVGEADDKMRLSGLRGRVYLELSADKRGYKK